MPMDDIVRIFAAHGIESMVLVIMDNVANRTPRDWLHDSITRAGSPSLKPPILGMISNCPPIEKPRRVLEYVFIP